MIQRRPLPRGLSHQFLGILEAHALTEEIVKVIMQDRHVLWHFMMEARKLVPFLGESEEEVRARKIMGEGYYFGLPEAYQFLGEKIDFSKEYHSLVDGIHLDEAALKGLREENYALVWIPAISLQGMRAMLPLSFFTEYHNNHEWPLKEPAPAWAQEEMKPGFRLFRHYQRDSPPLENERIPDVCEVAYLQLVLWLTGSVFFQSFRTKHMECGYFDGQTRHLVHLRFYGYHRDYSTGSGYEFDSSRTFPENCVATLSCQML